MQLLPEDINTFITRRRGPTVYPPKNIVRLMCRNSKTQFTARERKKNKSPPHTNTLQPDHTAKIYCAFTCLKQWSRGNATRVKIRRRRRTKQTARRSQSARELSLCARWVTNTKWDDWMVCNDSVPCWAAGADCSVRRIKRTPVGRSSI